jgi:hypothetical protein
VGDTLWSNWLVLASCLLLPAMPWEHSRCIAVAVQWRKCVRAEPGAAPQLQLPACAQVRVRARQAAKGAAAGGRPPGPAPSLRPTGETSAAIARTCSQ